MFLPIFMKILQASFSLWGRLIYLFQLHFCAYESKRNATNVFRAVFVNVFTYL